MNSKNVKIIKFGSAFKPTKDNWHPSFVLRDFDKDGKEHFDYLVKVSYMRLSDGEFRVCAWGDDDYGMEFDTPSFIKSRKIWKNILKQEFISRKYLKDIGFVNA